MLNQTKSSKTYNLAIQFSQYPNIQSLKRNERNTCNSRGNQNSYRLPKIIDVDQDDRQFRKKTPFQNIFNTQKHQNIRADELANQNSFNIVGKKQVKAYQAKLTKKKNIVPKRNESALSLSRYSSSVKSQNQNSLYLNKEDVLSFLRPSQNQTLNDTKVMRQEQMVTIDSHKSSSSKFQKDMSTLRKCKDKMMDYTKTWDHQKLKKSKFPSILDNISHYRSKVQYLQNNALNERRKFIKENIWMQTLRTQKNVENFYNDKFVEKILNDNHKFSLKGKDKLQKQMLWIDEKDKAGYKFAFLDSLNIKTTNKNSMSKDEKLGESAVNKTFLRQSSPTQKNKEGQKVNKQVFNKSFSNLKSALNGNKLDFQGKLKQSKIVSPPALSYFSTTGSNFLSPLKHGRMTKEKRQDQSSEVNLSKLR